MTNDKFNDSLNALLKQGRMNYAISTLRSKCENSLSAHPDLQMVMTELDAISNVYTYLRNFLLEGKSDPERNAIMAELKERVREAARNYLFIVNENRPDPFFAEYRLQKIRPSSVAQISDSLAKTAFRIEMARETEADSSAFIRTREQLADTLFRKVWSLPPWAKEEHAYLRELLTASDSSDSTQQARSFHFTLKAQVISALLLGLLKFNDPAKLSLLIEAYNAADSDRLAARALTAIVLVLGRWGSSALSTPRLEGELRELEDSLLTYSRVRDIVMILIRTRDTDRVSREVSEAFKATMREISPEMLERLQREGLTADSADTGHNPEWEKLMQNHEIEDRMKAINDMQLEGMDVMMQTFARLKSFPFFNLVSNWFLPFSEDNTAIEGLFSTMNFEGFSLMADATDMCAGDRFSFALGILQMPEERRNLLAMTMGAQLESLRDMVKDSGNVARKPEFATEALVFARDLYRFAKLYPKRKDFYDPFEEPIDFLQLPLLSSLLKDDDIILKAADFYFQHGYFNQALSLFISASPAGDSAENDADFLRTLYEKIGYCHQMTGDLTEAIRNYERADLFSSDADRSSTWLLRKLAFCNKALGLYDKAAKYYRRLLERNPGDLKLEFHLGSVLLRMGEVKEGKDLISKVHYMDPGHKMASRVYTRLKGHEAFLNGQYQEALNLYGEARGDQPQAAYRNDLISELTALAPDAEAETLKILLDSGE